MQVETQERPQVEEQEQKCKECKNKREYQEMVYKKLLELNDVSHENMAKTIQMDVKENGDPYSRFLVNLVETSPIEDKKTLWNEICKAILGHFTYGAIEHKVDEMNFALDAMGEVNGENSVMVKVTNGKKSAVMTFPMDLLKDQNLETDEDIINFAKSRVKTDVPNKALQDDNAEYKVLRGDEVNEEMRKSQELLLQQLRGENKECQTNNEQTIKQ